MTGLATTIRPDHVRHSAGDLMVGNVRINHAQALRLVEIWREEKISAHAALDEHAWRVASDLHRAMLRAVLDADQWRRDSREIAA